MKLLKVTGAYDHVTLTYDRPSSAMNTMLLRQLKSGTEKVIESPNVLASRGDASFLQNHLASALV